TFIENARIKAVSLKNYLLNKQPSGVAMDETYIVADDSGLECEDLDGQPGVQSARFAGEHATDAENNAKLVSMFAVTTHLTRAAQYVCALVLLFPDGSSKEIIETCQGFITLSPQGDGGFGYDPHFYLDRYNKTMAELPLDEKNKISHRGKAIRKLVRILQDEV
ncbi:MAG: non-canonical purine NTP pyrophosphatase, partial [Deltaproteobacteria bacterium]|nr:non-canonical purine NTP pyrophosphatase [Deltaproteobacteria bacterium]